VVVKRGTTVQTEGQALTALAGNDDSTFDVENDDTESPAVAYVVTFALLTKVRELTVIVRASASVQCDLALDYWNWRRRRWKKTTFSSPVTTAEATFAGPTVSPRRFVRRDRVKARIRCANTAPFGNLGTDQIDLIAIPV
jgi:hypothetical protein